MINFTRLSPFLSIFHSRTGRAWKRGLQVASVPLGLVSVQAQLISRNTRSVKLAFVQKATAVVIIAEFVRIQDYEKWREGVYARDKLNI